MTRVFRDRRWKELRERRRIGFAVERLEPRNLLTGINIDDATVFEDGGEAHVRVWTNGNFSTTCDVMIRYETENDTAIGGEDFEPRKDVWTRIQWPDTETTIAIPVTNDSAFEGNERFSVKLTAAAQSGCTDGAIFNRQVARVNIVDDEGAAPNITIKDSRALEGFQNTFEVRVSSVPGDFVRVNYETVSGTAIEGTDFSREAGSLTFTTGNEVRSIGVRIIEDTIVEQEEWFRVRLFTPVNAVISDDEAIGRIVDNDVVAPPIAGVGGPYDIAEGDELALDGTTSERAASYEWYLNGSSSIVSREPQPTISWERLLTDGVNDNGTYAVRLVVKDANGETAEDITDVVVANGRPTADAGPDHTIRSVGGITLVGDGTDPSPIDEASLTYSWVITNSTGGVVETSNTVAFFFRPQSNGTFVAMLTVEDKDGGTHVDTVAVVVDVTFAIPVAVGTTDYLGRNIYGGAGAGGDYYRLTSVPRAVTLLDNAGREIETAVLDDGDPFGAHAFEGIAAGTYEVFAFSHRDGERDNRFNGARASVTVGFDEASQPVVPLVLTARAELDSDKGWEWSIGVVDLVDGVLGGVLNLQSAIPIVAALWTVNPVLGVLIGKALASSLLQHFVFDTLRGTALAGYEIEVDHRAIRTWDPKNGDLIEESEFDARLLTPDRQVEREFILRPADTIAIHAHSPVSLVVEDPSGRRAGVNAGTTGVVITYDELPHTYATDGETTTLFINKRAYAPWYRLFVYGTGEGVYSLDIETARTADIDDIHVGTQLVRPGDLDVYGLTFPLDGDAVIGSGVIEGDVYQDRNANGTKDADDVGLSGRRVYIDNNQNGEFDIADQSTVTRSDGTYEFNGLSRGVYSIGQTLETDWVQTEPGDLGPTFPVNTNISDNLRMGSTVMNKAGDFVVSWIDDDSAYARRYSTSGREIELAISQESKVGAHPASMAMRDDGSFIAVWEGKVPGSEKTDIYARIFDPTGQAGDELIVNAPTDKNSLQTRVAVDSEGNFVIVWAEHNTDQSRSEDAIFGKILDGGGNTVRDQFVISAVSGLQQGEPTVVTQPQGGFLVSWMRLEGSAWNLYGQLRDSSAVVIRGEIRLSDDLFSNQVGPAPMATDAAGNFVVLWGKSGVDTWDIGGRRFTAAGDPFGDEFTVHTDLIGGQFLGLNSVVSDAAGNFTVSWQSGHTVMIRRFSRVDNIATEEFPIATGTRASVAIDAEGTVIVAWRQPGVGIFAKHFTPSLNLPVRLVDVGVGEAVEGNDFGNSMFVVTEMAATSTGFSAEFSSVLDPSTLNLFGAESDESREVDVVLEGESGGMVSGSLIVDSSLRRITFVKAEGVLEADTYTATLNGGGGGFVNDRGVALDGNSDGTAGDNFVGSFLIEPPVANSVTFSLPDIVRGPGQPLEIRSGGGVGFPLSISGGDKVRSAEIEIHYDPTLLQIRSAIVPEGMTASVETREAGLAYLKLDGGPATLPEGSDLVVSLEAHVPSADATEIYGRSHVIDIEVISVVDTDGSELVAVADDAVHVVEYFGDVTGNGTINASDASRIARFVVQSPPFLPEHLLTDPAIVADISGNGRINALDAALVLQFSALIGVEEIPPIPAIVESIVPGAHSQNAPANGALEVTFNRRIFPDGLSDDTVVVSSQKGRLEASEIEVRGSTLLWHPSQPFGAGEAVEVTLTSGVDEASPRVPFVWKFQIAVEAGSGTFHAPGGDLSVNTWSVSIGDLNGDGHPDAFFGNWEANHVYLNDGLGSLHKTDQELGSSVTQGSGVADMDGDGDLDIFTVNADAKHESNRVWLNDGNGRFVDSGQRLGDGASRSVDLGDIDGDGDQDAVVANFDNQANTVWINDGTGMFADSSQRLGDAESRATQLLDVDHDGDLDVFFANGDETSQPNKVYLNNGFGEFIDSGQNLGDALSHTAAIGDVNGDGSVDIVVGNWGSGNTIWLNDGNGVFTGDGQRIGESKTEAVALGDLDGDGDLDLVAVSLEGENRVYLNAGNGRFEDANQVLGQDGTALALADVDNDGDLDAFIVNDETSTPLDTLWRNGVLGRIHGWVFIDWNRNGTQDPNEEAISSQTVYVDQNANGKLDASEQSTTTVGDGSYVLRDLPPGSYHVRLHREEGWRATSPIAIVQQDGDSMLINSHVVGQQLGVDIASDENGNTVSVWQSEFQDGSDWGIFGQRLDANGDPLGGEFPVNTFTNGRQEAASVAVDRTGNFVVAWASFHEEGAGGDVYVRRFDASGTPLDDREFRANTFNAGAQGSAKVALDGVGNFVVVWNSEGQDGSEFGVFARRFDASGQAIDVKEFQINTTTEGHQWRPDVAMTETGEFVVVWESHHGDTSSVLHQLYDANGVRVREERPVHTYLGTQFNQTIAIDAAGNYLAVWTSVGQDGDREGVFARRFDASGQVIDVEEFQVNTTSVSVQRAASVAMDRLGNFVISWMSGSQIDAQRFAASGQRLGEEFRLVDGDGSDPVVAMAPSGDFVIAFWQRTGALIWDVFTQRYNLLDSLQMVTLPPGRIQTGLTFGISRNEPSVSFFTSPGTDPTGDLRFREAAPGVLTELDFEQFSAGHLIDVLEFGSDAIDINILNDDGSLFSNEAIILPATETEEFTGTIDHLALRSYAEEGKQRQKLEFVFTQPVDAFGLWIYDDGASSLEQFVMTVTLSSGEEMISGVLDSRQGFDQDVEGFLGAVSHVGIEKAVVEAQTIGGVPPLPAFQVDHIQVGSSVVSETLKNGDVNQASYPSALPTTVVPLLFDLPASHSDVQTIRSATLGRVSAAATGNYERSSVDRPSRLTDADVLRRRAMNPHHVPNVEHVDVLLSELDDWCDDSIIDNTASVLRRTAHSAGG